MTAVEVTITGPQDDIERIAGELLDARLIACAQMWPITSKYWWLGRQQSAREMRAAFHTSESLVAKVLETVESSHPYDVACAISTKIQDGSERYLLWILAETKNGL